MSNEPLEYATPPRPRGRWIVWTWLGVSIAMGMWGIFWLARPQPNLAIPPARVVSMPKPTTAAPPALPAPQPITTEK